MPNEALQKVCREIPGKRITRLTITDLPRNQPKEGLRRTTTPHRAPTENCTHKRRTNAAVDIFRGLIVTQGHECVRGRWQDVSFERVHSQAMSC